MAEGSQRASWARTSSLMALTANCHRDPKRGRAARPGDFDPYARADRRKDAIVIDESNVELFEKAFTGQGENHERK